MVSEKVFGTLSDGKECRIITITNGKGESVELVNLGAAVHAIHVLDRDGKLDDVTMGVPEARDLEGNTMEGVIIGRVANSIKNGEFVQNGQLVRLEKGGRGGHFMHGGSGNYAKKFFTAEYDPAGSSVTFSYRDTGEGGWGNCVDVKITYSFNDLSELDIHYDLMPEADTALSPTNHTYFNLSGGDIRELELKVFSDQAAAKDETNQPDGTTVPVEGTAADFTEPVTIGERLARETRKGFNEYFVIPGEGFRQAASLYCRENGRRMDVYTDMQCLILFTANKKEPVPGKDGKTYKGYCAVCLEAQFVPNAVNCPQFASPLFKAGERFEANTRYSFSAD